MLRVRTMTDDDADAVADAHVTSWQVGYRGVVPDEVLDDPGFRRGRLEGWRTGRWRTWAPGSAVLVVEADGEVIGFGHVGRERVDDGAAAGERGEVYAFYLHPRAWGGGGAGALMRASEHELRTRGFADAVLWVLRDNPRGRGFYDKAGWASTGRAGAFEVGGVTLADVQYGRSLR